MCFLLLCRSTSGAVRELDRNVELLGIKSHRTINPSVEFRLHQLPQNVGSGSDHEAQLQRHRQRRRPRHAVHARAATVQRYFIAKYPNADRSLTLPRLIKIFNLQNPIEINDLIDDLMDETMKVKY